jgi:nuclear pore complex protein Nup205
MAEITTLDALQAFHQELVSIRERRGDGVESLNNEFLVQVFEKELEKLWNKPARNDQSRNKVKSGRYRCIWSKTKQLTWKL